MQNDNLIQRTAYLVIQKDQVCGENEREVVCVQGGWQGEVAAQALVRTIELKRLLGN